MLKRIISSCVVAISIVTLLPSFVSAEISAPNVAKLVSVQCECWCGLEGRGAKPQGTETSQDACYINCTDRGEKFLACSKAGDQSSPHTNSKCWETTECAKSNGRPSDKTPAECMPSFVYCYPVDKPIKLALSIDGVSEVLGIGGYIKVVYQWLLGVAAVFAIIMIIIGGIKYMVAGGSPNGVKEARKDIFNALIGMVILLCTYLILATVNPQLLSLRMPSLPMVRRIDAPSAVNSCEGYYELGYTLYNSNNRPFYSGTQACGTKGILKKGPDGEVLSGEDVCYFKSCTEKGTICRINYEEEKGFCDSCIEMPGTKRTGGEGSSEESPYRKRYPKPSSAVCNAIGLPAGIIGKCFYRPPASTLLGLIELDGDKCVELQYDCSQTSGCQSYDNFKIRYGAVSGDDLNVLDTLETVAKESAIFESLCEDNVCEYNLSNGGCKMVGEVTKGTLTCVPK